MKSSQVIPRLVEAAASKRVCKLPSGLDFRYIETSVAPRETGFVEVEGPWIFFVQDFHKLTFRDLVMVQQRGTSEHINESMHPRSDGVMVPTYGMMKSGGCFEGDAFIKADGDESRYPFGRWEHMSLYTTRPDLQPKLHLGGSAHLSYRLCYGLEPRIRFFTPTRFHV